MPAKTKFVGYPSPDSKSIYVSKSDVADLAAYLVALQSWIASASVCLEAK